MRRFAFEGVSVVEELEIAFGGAEVIEFDPFEVYDMDYFWDYAEDDTEGFYEFKESLLIKAENGTLTAHDLDFYCDWSKEIYGSRDRSLNYLYSYIKSA